MKTKIIRSLFIPLLVTLGGASVALADQAVYSCVNADGSIELTSASTGPKCELLSLAQPATVTPGAAATAPAAVEKNAEPTVDNSAEQSAVAVTVADKTGNKDEVDPRMAYRDAMIKGAQHAEGATAAAMNPAINRRYLKVDRAAFRQTIGADPVQ